MWKCGMTLSHFSLQLYLSYISPLTLPANEAVLKFFGQTKLQNTSLMILVKLKLNLHLSYMCPLTLPPPSNKGFDGFEFYATTSINKQQRLIFSVTWKCEWHSVTSNCTFANSMCPPTLPPPPSNKGFNGFALFRACEWTKLLTNYA